MVFQLAILATTLFDRLIWCADDAINEGEGMGEAIVQRLATQEVIAQAVGAGNNPLWQSSEE